MIQKIKIRRGRKSDLPFLDIGEFGLCTDTQELYLGTERGNELINKASNGSITVEDSSINGNIKINGQEVKIYDDTSVTLDVSGLQTELNKAFGQIKKLQDDLANLPSGGGGGSTVGTSTINGNIKINGQEVKVYDDASLTESMKTKSNVGHTHTIADVTGLQTKLDDSSSKIKKLQDDLASLPPGGSVPNNVVLFEDWAGGESVTIDNGGTPPVAEPPVVTINPNGGSFTGSQQVTISVDKTATIYYTLDGTVPTTNSTVYSAPIVLTDTKTLKAFAKASDGKESTVKTATFTKTEEGGGNPGVTINPPTELKASNVSDTGLTLTWKPSTSTISGYEIYNGAAHITMVTGTTYNVTGLTKGTDYTFNVKAKDAGGNFSVPATVTVKTIDPNNAQPVTDGMILHLDALDKATYAISGTNNTPVVWKDKSPVGNDMTLTPKSGWAVQASVFSDKGFDPTSGGLAVGGSLPYKTFSDYPITWEFIVKLPKGVINELVRVFDGTNFYRINHSIANEIAFNKNTAGGTLINFKVPDNFYTDHEYMHVVAVIKSTNAKLYINGTLAQAGDSTYNALNKDAVAGVAQYQYVESNMKGSKLKAMRSYNRELSSSEVLNNYLASLAIMG
jgi:hypothetical protein